MSDRPQGQGPDVAAPILEALGFLGRNHLLVAAHRLADDFDAAGPRATDQALVVAEQTYVRAVVERIAAASLAEASAPAEPECDGSGRCPATLHVHGCYADVDGAACDDPDDHDAPAEPEQGNQVTASEKWLLDVIVHVRPFRSDSDRLDALVSCVTAILASRASGEAGHACLPGPPVARKFDGGRGALLCEQCNRIVGYLPGDASGEAELRGRVELLAEEWVSWSRGRTSPRIDAFRDAAEHLRTALDDTGGEGR